MNPPEAKFLLCAYRPNGADAPDADLAEAVRLAQRDPELATWFATQRKFDEVIARRLQEVRPPPEMRDELRAGITLQANERRRAFRRSLALGTITLLAASVIVLCFPRLPAINFMNQTFLYALTVTGFGVAFLHAAIPTHWLPFVVVGRARGWSHRRILAAVALAGGGHVIATTALGVGLAWFGFELNERFDQVFHWVAGLILVGLGVWLAFRAPHGHACNHCQGHPEKLSPGTTDRAALWGLFLTLTLSPCELFLPVYLTAAPYGWPGIVWLSAVLGFATLGGMLTLTWLTLHAVQRLRWLERLDERVIGGLLCLLGVVTVAFSH
jgi:nickel/cobalt exporter